MQAKDFSPSNFSVFLFSRACVKISKSANELFSLKSGRKSPVFVNMGSLIDGEALEMLANAYAGRIHQLLKSKELEEFDFIFGPAYKGIPLGALTCAALYRNYKISKKFLYDRKEEKAHGDVKADQIIVGANQFTAGSKILMIDDVIATGGAKFEAWDKIKSVLPNPKLAGILVAIDRQECGGDDKIKSENSAADEIKQKLNCPLYSIADMGDLFEGLRSSIAPAQAKMWKDYFKKWGTKETKEWAGKAGL